MARCGRGPDTARGVLRRIRYHDAEGSAITCGAFLELRPGQPAMDAHYTRGDDRALRPVQRSHVRRGARRVRPEGSRV